MASLYQSLISIPLVEAQIIDGKKYILIPAEDGMGVNGLAVHLGNNISYKTDFYLPFPKKPAVISSYNIRDLPPAVSVSVFQSVHGPISLWALFSCPAHMGS